jgi:hypothetical protein
MPYGIYRSIILWNPNTIEIDLTKNNLDYGIEIPLLLLRLINRCLNPFIFICIIDKEKLRRDFCRLWCLPCLPGCIGCRKCWCYDCGKTFCFECDHFMGNDGGVSAIVSSDSNDWVPTGLQTISTHQYRDGEVLVTRQKIKKEYETGVEPYYKNPYVIGTNRVNLGYNSHNYSSGDIYRAYSNNVMLQPVVEEPKRVKL